MASGRETTAGVCGGIRASVRRKKGSHLRRYSKCLQRRDLFILVVPGITQTYLLSAARLSIRKHSFRPLKHKWLDAMLSFNYAQISWCPRKVNGVCAFTFSAYFIVSLTVRSFSSSYLNSIPVRSVYQVVCVHFAFCLILSSLWVAVSCGMGTFLICLIALMTATYVFFFVFFTCIFLPSSMTKIMFAVSSQTDFKVKVWNSSVEGLTQSSLFMKQ